MITLSGLVTAARNILLQKGSDGSLTAKISGTKLTNPFANNTNTMALERLWYVA